MVYHKLSFIYINKMRYNANGSLRIESGNQEIRVGSENPIPLDVPGPGIR
jgi:hypothetical protein